MTSLTVALTGQVLLHGPLDLCGPGDRVRELIGEADLAAVNLEATVATEGAWPTKTKTLHPANPDGIASNNHAFDLAPPGLAQTRVVAEGAGLHLVGRGENRDEAARPVDVELRESSRRRRRAGSRRGCRRGRDRSHGRTRSKRA